MVCGALVFGLLGAGQALSIHSHSSSHWMGREVSACLLPIQKRVKKERADATKDALGTDHQ